MTKQERYKKKYPHKIKAHNRAYHIHKEPQPCSINKCAELGQRHHPNYKNKEEIIWLCRKHHLIVHGKVRGTCSVCKEPHHAKGFCRTHYRKNFPEKFYGKQYGKSHR